MEYFLMQKLRQSLRFILDFSIVIELNSEITGMLKNCEKTGIVFV